MTPAPIAVPGHATPTAPGRSTGCLRVPVQVAPLAEFDTPSKVRRTMDNFLWLSTFTEREVAGSDDELLRMRDFIREKLVDAPDVRDVLPHRL